METREGRNRRQRRGCRGRERGKGGRKVTNKEGGERAMEEKKQAEWNDKDGNKGRNAQKRKARM